MKAVLLLCLLAVSAALAMSSAPRQVVFNRKSFPSEWHMVGFPAPGSSVKFYVALRQRNLDKLTAKFFEVSTPSSPSYQQFMTRDEVLDMIAPPKVEKDIVLSWLRSEGVNINAQVQDQRDVLVVEVPVSVAEQLFQTSFYLFKHEQRKNLEIVRAMGEYSIPRVISRIIDMVIGVSEFPMLKRNPKLSPMADGAVVPQTLQSVYNIPASASASNTTQGVIEFQSGEYYSPSALQTFAKQTGVTIAAISKDHDVNPLPPVGVEGTLDIQYIAAVAPGAQNWYWTGSDWLYGWASQFFAAATVPSVVSISYGWSEAAQCEVTSECQQLGVDSQGYVNRVNTEFQKIGVRGVSILCASGDSGANGRTDPGCTDTVLHPDFPAASPYLTSVGATQLLNEEFKLSNPPPLCKSQFQCASGGEETAVSFTVSSFTSGGGFSNYAPLQDYQSAVVKNYLSTMEGKLPPATYFNNSGRGYPDVAALGHNFAIYDPDDEGGWVLVGGTSASSPSFAGMISLLNQVSQSKTGKPLGFLNPFLYQAASAHPAAFRDITIGDNKCTEDGCATSCKGFLCAKGWDPVTGLGVPNVQEMINYLNSMLDSKIAQRK